MLLSCCTEGCRCLKKDNRQIFCRVCDEVTVEPSLPDHGLPFSPIYRAFLPYIWFKIRPRLNIQIYPHFLSSRDMVNRGYTVLITFERTCLISHLYCTQSSLFSIQKFLNSRQNRDIIGYFYSDSIVIFNKFCCDNNITWGPKCSEHNFRPQF